MSQGGTQPIIGDSGIRKLSTVTGIDGNALGETTLYTVPVGKVLIPIDAIIRTTTGTGGSGDFVYNIGSNSATYDNFISDGAINVGASYVAGTYYSAIQIGSSIFKIPASVITAGEIVKLKITTAGASDPITFSVDLFGYLLDA